MERTIAAKRKEQGVIDKQTAIRILYERGRGFSCPE
jgi:hypothetical protein